MTKSQRATNVSGTVVSVIDMDPFGGETSRSINVQLMSSRFTSYERDGNGGDEAQARRFEGQWTRFSQPDPSSGSYRLSNPQSFNRYTYASNDPINRRDPSGLEECTFDTAGNCVVQYQDEGVITIGGDFLTLLGLAFWSNLAQGPIILPGPITDPGSGVQTPQDPRRVFDDSFLGPPPPLPIYCQPDVIAAMRRAWSRTQNGTSRNEAGFVLNGSPSNYQIVENQIRQHKRRTEDGYFRQYVPPLSCSSK